MYNHDRLPTRAGTHRVTTLIDTIEKMSDSRDGEANSYCGQGLTQGYLSEGGGYGQEPPQY